MSRSSQLVGFVLDVLSSGFWMVVRVLSLAVWIWLLVRALPAENFGWLVSVLAVSTVCILIAPLGIPYLFFADAQAREGRERRWREALGALLIVGPSLAIAGALFLHTWLDGGVPIWITIVFLIVDVLAGAVAQTGGLWGHAAGRLGIAAGLPTALIVARVVSAGLCSLVVGGDDAALLVSYLVLHAVLVTVVAVVTTSWVARTTAGRWWPVLPSMATCSSAWRYAVMGGSGLMLSELDKPFLVRVMGLQYVGFYAMAYRVCACLAMPATALAAALLPRWAAMSAQSDDRRLKRSFLMALLVVVASGAFLALVLKAALVALPPGAFSLYAEAWTWMSGLAWLGVVLGIHQVSATAMLAIGRPLTRTLFDMAGFGLLAILAFATFPELGAQGVIIACLLAESLVAISMTLTFFFLLGSDVRVPGGVRET